MRFELAIGLHKHIALQIAFKLASSFATINANCHYVFGGKIRQAIVVDRKAKKRFGQHTLRRNNESRNTCHRPNRLNLLNWTATSGPRSNFLRKKWVKTGGKTHLLMCGARICGRGQPPLHLKTEFRLL